MSLVYKQRLTEDYLQNTFGLIKTSTSYQFLDWTLQEAHAGHGANSLPLCRLKNEQRQPIRWKNNDLLHTQMSECVLYIHLLVPMILEC